MQTIGKAAAGVVVGICLVTGFGARGADELQPALTVEQFEKDPGWEGHNNRVVPKSLKTVEQNFGHSATNFAGNAAGEIGGRIWRCSTPASYADKIAAKTLNDRLSASGTFALKASSGSS